MIVATLCRLQGEHNIVYSVTIAETSSCRIQQCASERMRAMSSAKRDIVLPGEIWLTISLMKIKNNKGLSMHRSLWYTRNDR